MVGQIGRQHRFQPTGDADSYLEEVYHLEVQPLPAQIRLKRGLLR